MISVQIRKMMEEAKARCEGRIRSGEKMKHMDHSITNQLKKKYI